MISPSSRRAHVVGLGLIGSSLALALARRGWLVSGIDLDPRSSMASALRRRRSSTPTCSTTRRPSWSWRRPRASWPETAAKILRDTRRPDLIVTDVAGVKGAIVDEVADPRFLAGSPDGRLGAARPRGRARRSLPGVHLGAHPDLADQPETYSTLHGILRELGANVVAVDADDHDRLVAVASHVPHLLAGALMNEASRVAEQDAILLQLAAGGFRDMTRVAAGDPSIWPDVLFENRDAISQSLQALEDRLPSLRDALLRATITTTIASDLMSAASARASCPVARCTPRTSRTCASR